MRTLCGTILVAAMAAHGAGGAFVPEDYSIWVDPFVGTSATGHTFPAACVPFGLVQAGPDTGVKQGLSLLHVVFSHEQEITAQNEFWPGIHFVQL